MININSRIGKLRYRAEMIREFAIFEIILRKMHYKYLDKEYKDIIKKIRETENSYEWFEEINNIVERQRPQLTKELQNNYRKIMNRVLDKFNKSLEKQFDISFWNLIDKWILVNTAEQITKTSRTTKKRIRYVISKLLAKGYSNKEIAKNIESVYPISEGLRAEMIAITEVHSAVNAGQYQFGKINKLIKMKEWISAKNERTREAHIMADGEKVMMDEDFIFTGEPLDFPGDPAGSARNIIKCRCAMLFHTKIVA